MRILIIEDQEKLAKSLKKGLEHEGYAVDYLLDGIAGEQHLTINHQDYDAVILDVMLPGKDGIAVCKSWRAEHITTPVLMLTAKDATSDKIRGLDCGADDYLIKPFSFEELVARVRALMRRPKQALLTTLALGDLSLNTVTKRVLCGAKQITLTLKEFGVLEYLMRHPDQIISREKILDHVWDIAYDSFSNVVDVHVKNLRKKLSVCRYDKKLETIRGAGYRLKA